MDLRAQWTELYDMHAAHILRFLLQNGAPAADVEDLGHQVFLVVHARLQRGEQVEYPAAWLRAIALRVLAQHRRWRRVRQVKAWLLRDRPSTAAAMASPDAACMRHETCDQVATVLDKLSPKLREVLVLTDIEHRSVQESAKILRISVNTLRSRRRLAKERFRALWQRRHGDFDAG
ncbi:MAG: RNA polymerase sigma factor [Polyangiales bacterium]